MSVVCVGVVEVSKRVCVCLLFLGVSVAECAEPVRRKRQSLDSRCVSILGMTDHETGAGAATRQRRAAMSPWFSEWTSGQKRVHV